MALFDVKNIEELHQYLNEWADMIPAQFEIYPLLDATNAKAFLATGATEAKAQKSGGIAEIIDASAHRHVILSSPNPLSCLLIAGIYRRSAPSLALLALRQSAQNQRGPTCNQHDADHADQGIARKPRIRLGRDPQAGE